MSIDGKEIPTILVNRFNLAVGDNGCRIAFAESFQAPEKFYRCAVQLSLDDAEELADMMTRLICQIKEQKT